MLISVITTRTATRDLQIILVSYCICVYLAVYIFLKKKRKKKRTWTCRCMGVLPAVKSWYPPGPPHSHLPCWVQPQFEHLRKYIRIHRSPYPFPILGSWVRLPQTSASPYVVVRCVVVYQSMCIKLQAVYNTCNDMYKSYSTQELLHGKLLDFLQGI